MTKYQDKLANDWSVAEPAHCLLPPLEGFGIKRVQRLGLPAVGGGMAPAHLITFAVEEFSISAFDAFAIMLPPAIKRSVRKRQAEFFFGRLAARLALTSFGLGHLQVPVGPAREPVWPLPVAGSITHNEHLAGAIALPRNSTRGIGIDVETVVSESMQAVMKAAAVSAVELRYLHTLAADLDLNTLLTIVFSVKESFFKAAFNEVKEFFDFDALHVDSIEIKHRTIVLFLRKTLSPRLLAGTTLSAHFDMVDPGTVITISQLR